MKSSIKLLYLLFLFFTFANADEIQITGILRDFKQSHPDFQYRVRSEQGIVLPNLTANRKPIYNPAGSYTTTGAANFNQWYNDVGGVNMSMPYTITLKKSNGVYTYDSNVEPKGKTSGGVPIGFFPLDNLLFGNEGAAHNYFMTMEIHSQFTYTGGEVFTFSGDDDCWVFINNRLAVDIGGVHGRIEKSINLDTLGLTVGETYNFDMFWAERHFSQSNFKITTTIALGESLKGKFNVERTNSHTTGAINSDERNAWYTQIVGRDFDYSVVFYEDDYSAEKEIEDVTYKVQLYDNVAKNYINEMSPYYGHFSNSNPTSRQNITPSNDLNGLSAYKDIQFHISYPVDDEDNIVTKECVCGTIEQCFNELESNSSITIKTEPAKDSFAVRPKYFYMNVADGVDVRKENNNNLNNPLKLAAGYNYKFEAIASTYTSDITGSPKYDNTPNRVLKFITPGTCADGTDKLSLMTFIQGYATDLNFSHSNVGQYNLSIRDDSWANVDIFKPIPDCIQNSGQISSNGNELSGCNIEPISDINTSYYPYYFDLNFTMGTLPSSGHDEFIYMSDINKTYNDYAVQFKGNITAKSKNNLTTTNFTQGCAAENVQLRTNTTTRTDMGINVFPIQTSENHLKPKEDIDISRMARFNNEPFTVATYDTFENIATFPLNITQDKFLDPNEGTLPLELRYNIKKHVSQTINPVEIVFETLESDSPLSASNTDGKVIPDFIPQGKQDFNTTKYFYFTQVSSDKVNYPSVFFQNNTFLRTPLNVEIFCDKNISFCDTMKIPTYTDTGSLSKVSQGWYTSIVHHNSLDGNVTNLVPSSTDLTVNPNNNIGFTDGRNSTIINTFANCTNSNQIIKVDMIPSPVLRYDSNVSNGGIPSYFLSCINQQGGQLSGVGETGMIIESDLNLGEGQKVSW